MQDFKKLTVWQLAHKLRVQIYDVVAPFPRDELYGLRSQSTRAAGSIAANIAEGCGRDGDREFARFLRIALGSATELECHLLCARDKGFARPEAIDPFLAKLDEVQRMLAALIRTIGADLERPHKTPPTMRQKEQG